MLQEVSSDAHSIGAWRECAHSGGINYAGKLEVVGHRAVRAIVEGATNEGHLADRDPFDESEPWFGTLDVYDTNGVCIQDFVIPSKEAWLWWRNAVELRPIADRDCDICDVR